MKKILVISYSQSGQLEDIVASVLSPLNHQNIHITHRHIVPIKPYPYPWDLLTFMDTFPESALLTPCPIETMQDDDEYDLIILAYQVWFLSPSIPTTAFLKSSYAKEKLNNKPVITLIGCRNMWVMASLKVKMLLDEIGAHWIDNIVLTDPAASYTTFITTPRWLLTGKKDALWGIFPKAGISETQIHNAQRFGKAILFALKNHQSLSSSLCHGLGACRVDEKLIYSEQIGARSFALWGRMIQKMGYPGDQKRKPLILLYLIFLCTLIITIVPINMLIQSIRRKLNPQKIKKMKAIYEQPSGSADNRITEFL